MVSRIMNFVFAFMVIFSVCLCLQGCESEKSKLETERVRLEVEKLKREKADHAAREAARKEFYKTDKLKNYKSKPDPF